jgi:hypothetical protein
MKIPQFQAFSRGKSDPFEGKIKSPKRENINPSLELI